MFMTVTPPLSVKRTRAPATVVGLKRMQLGGADHCKEIKQAYQINQDKGVEL